MSLKQKCFSKKALNRRIIALHSVVAIKKSAVSLFLCPTAVDVRYSVRTTSPQDRTRKLKPALYDNIIVEDVFEVELIAVTLIKTWRFKLSERVKFLRTKEHCIELASVKRLIDEPLFAMMKLLHES